MVIDQHFIPPVARLRVVKCLVAVQGQYVFVLKETEPVDEKTYRYTGKIEMWDRERFRKECKYGYAYRNYRMEDVNAARKELGLELIETAKQDA
jgi:hypothetical protein